MAARKAKARKKNPRRPRAAKAAAAAAVPRPTKPGQPDPIPDWSDEHAELLGGLLWAEFAKGAGKCTYGVDVIAEGRKLSRGWIRHNLVNQESDFPLLETLNCAWDCGAACAEAAGWGGTITPEIFNTAWNEIADHWKLVAARAQRIRAAGNREPAKIRAGGCS